MSCDCSWLWFIITISKNAFSLCLLSRVFASTIPVPTRLTVLPAKWNALRSLHFISFCHISHLAMESQISSNSSLWILSTYEFDIYSPLWQRMEYSLLKDVTAESQHWTIRVRAIRFAEYLSNDEPPRILRLDQSIPYFLKVSMAPKINNFNWSFW